MDKKTVNIKNGNIVVRLAQSKEEVEQAQKLRYEILILNYDDSKDKQGLDACEHDEYCECLVAIDETTGKVVGTYRLMSNMHLEKIDSFICENEYDLTNLRNCGHNVLELGRAVVHQDYRNGLVIRMLWQGLFEYCKIHEIKYMFGLIGFVGTDAEKHKNVLSYLKRNYLVDENLDCEAKEPSVKYALLEKDQIDEGEAKKQVPSLLKGYLALGCKVASGSYIDYDFNSTDILIILDVENINKTFAKRMFGVEL